MLFDFCPVPLQMVALKDAENSLFFKYATLLEKEEDVDFNEVIAIGNKKFKGRFLKLFKIYKDKKKDEEKAYRENKYSKTK